MKSNSSRANRSTIQLLFLGLAALTLLVLGLSFGLFHHLASRHEAAVVLNRENAEQLSRVDRLENIEVALDAPGNDIFLSGDAPRERKRVADAGVAFRTEAHSLRGKLIGFRDARALEKVEIAAAAAAVVERDAYRTIDAFSRADLSAASHAMAEMDQAHTRVFEPLQRLANALRAKESLAFRNQESEFARIWLQEKIIGMALLLLTAAIVIYGRRAAREMITAARDRETYMDSIARLHRKTELILESAGDGLFGTDLLGISTFVNPAAAHILGYEPEELVGRHMHRVIHSRHEDGTGYPWNECVACHNLRDGGPRSATSVFWTKSGESVPVDLTATAMLDEKGAVTGSVMTFRDISERRAVDRMKDEFVSTVSHELRTPLTSIRGALGLLVSGRLGVLPEKAARLLEIASTNTDRLVRLINDILDIERMESGKATLSKVPTDATELVRQATDIMRPLADQAGITITVNAVGAPLVVDPDRIVQTLTNLIANAVKFSPLHSTIHVSAQATDGAVVFQVADQGRGIPPEKLDVVFERFKQVDASNSRDRGGSGLGLAICRSIVRQHGGEISVQSEMGHGSEFSFTIPMASATHGRLVFICDDEQEARKGMNVLLTAHGYRVMEFANVAELLAAALDQRPHLIMLNLFMPGMNGWEALARLRTDPRVAEIPVVDTSMLSPDESESAYIDLSGWSHKPREEAEPLPGVTGARGSGARPRRMLIVEDDADVARVIASSFERSGLEVIVASNGQQAINLAATLVPDLVILDLQLPEVDGFGVVDWIKDHDLWRSVPLIVYSARETTPAQQEQLRLGPTEFIIKSRIGPEEFERRVFNLLDQLSETKPPVPEKLAESVR
jgi:PAS domain S-box-containing protein